MKELEEPEPKKKRIGVRTLSTASDVKRLLARLIKARLAGDSIDDGCLRALTGACSVLLKSIEQSDTDLKLEEISRRLDEFEASRQ